MRNEWRSQVDPWELMVEHNQRIQHLERRVQELADLVQRLSEAHVTTTRTQSQNTQTIQNLARSHEQSLQLYLDLATRLNTGQEK